jgi:ABC-type antimicrobial peptide transport system permease subunit
VLSSLTSIASNSQGQRLISREPVVLNNLPKRSNGKPSNVTLRGTSLIGLELRPQVKIVSGRIFRPGTSEIIAGRATAAGFQGAGLGETLRFAQRDWLVVGVFDSGKTGFDSELWGDADQLMAAFRRQTYSTVVYKMTDPNALDGIKQTVADDVRLQLDAKTEVQFYTEQSEALATFIRILGLSLSVIFSIGAVVGAMITMFATVAQRVGEIGTLRALGFRRGAVLLAFMFESLLLALVGGVIGLVGASLMQNVNISTVNFQTFSELAFQFKLTPLIVAQALVFALGMGFVGGVIPAWRAARMKIVDCLREA